MVVPPEFIVPWTRDMIEDHYECSADKHPEWIAFYDYRNKWVAKLLYFDGYWCVIHKALHFPAFDEDLRKQITTLKLSSYGYPYENTTSVAGFSLILAPFTN